MSEPFNLLEQFHFAAVLELLSDLHIGSGNSEPAASNDEGEVALVVRDHKGCPYIPATALKGALRDTIDEGKRALYFGSIKDTAVSRVDGEEKKTDSGNIGLVWLHAATFERKADAGDLPRSGWKPHTFVTTHVMLDRKTGTARDKKLFNVERVPTGTRFRMTGIVFAAEAEAKEIAATVLAPLRSAEGLAVGSGGRFGSGRIRLKEATWWTRSWKTSRVKESKPVRLPVKKPSDDMPALLHFVCDGPFVSVDDAPRPNGGNSNTRKAARRSASRPYIAAEGIMGALRARAAWLATTQGLGDDSPERKPSTWFVAGTRQPDPVQLQPTELLFGVSGWKGALHIRDLSIGNAKLCDTPYIGIAIDRWTQGPLDGALYETEYFTGANFTIALACDLARVPMPKQGAVDTLMQLLLGDIKSNGLMLGHATNSGFGWFEQCERQQEGFPRD